DRHSIWRAVIQSIPSVHGAVLDKSFVQFHTAPQSLPMSWLTQAFDEARKNPPSVQACGF
ncbi:MAG: hypothetical protein ACI87L_000190, partial [Litorivivens sp.]